MYAPVQHAIEAETTVLGAAARAGCHKLVHSFLTRIIYAGLRLTGLLHVVTYR